MRKRILFLLCCAYLVIIHVNLANAEWRFPLYISYVSGMSDVKDEYMNTMNHESSYVKYDEGIDWPVGIAFQPYYQFRNGLRIGGGIGPILMIIGGSEDYFALPININAGYTFFPESSISPFIRAGLTYPCASGGYIEGQKMGFLGGVGMEFMRTRRVHIGFEVAVDTSEVEITSYKPSSTAVVKGTKNVKPVDFMASFFVSF